MKFRIGMRINRKDGDRIEWQKENNQLGICKKIENLYDMSKQTNKSHILNENKQKAIKFFNHYDQMCKIKYQATIIPSLDFMRKLEPQLQILAFPQQILKKERQFEMKQDTVPMTFNFSTRLQAQKREQIITNSTKSYFFQQKLQKLNKINSLICLNRNHSISSMSSSSRRRPGFIRFSKSYVKRQSSLQIPSTQSSYNNIQQIAPISTERANRQLCPLSQQMQSSKERIAKIRRELTQIYRLRGKDTKTRLKL